MAKEVLDNEKLKKTKKSGEGIYSEEAGNVLNENTPEGKYIADIELKIEEVNEKIKSNEKSLKEAEGKIPSDNEKEQFERNVVAEFSINKLSNFLSNEELEIIKKGRGFFELRDDIIRVGKIDPLNDLIEKIFEGIKNFSDEEKLIIANYLRIQEIILFDAESSIFKRCFVGRYYSDDPDWLNKAVQKNVKKLGLGEQIKYECIGRGGGYSVYALSKDYYNSILDNLVEQNRSEEEKEIELNFDQIKSKREKLENELKDLIEKQNAVKKFGLPESEAISLYQRSKDFECVHDEIYDKVNHVYVVLHEYSDYIRGAGGSEYGTVINIKRGKSTTKKSFMYRDRYDSEKDNPRHRYQKIKNVKVDGDRVEVTVSNGKSNDTYAFNVKYKPLKEGKVIDKEKFEEGIKTIKEQLIEENTKDRKYPVSHNFSLRKVPGYFSGGRDIEAEIPYEKAKIVYEDVIPEKGEAHITILMQKDDSGTRGRQFGLIKYIVTLEGAKKIDELDYREENLTDKKLQNKMNEFSNW